MKKAIKGIDLVDVVGILQQSIFCGQLENHLLGASACPVNGFEKSHQCTGWHTNQLASVFGNSGPQNSLLWIALKKGCRNIRNENKPGFASCNGQENLP